jgi:hypothetical protein
MAAMVLAGGALVACEHAPPLEPDLPAEPTLAAVQANIFNQSCALGGCHVGPQAPMDLDLSERNSYAHIVRVRSMQRPDLYRVEPGLPDRSYLVMKVEGAEGIVGARMPLGIPPLTPDQVQLLRQWIVEGAQDN